MADYLNINYLSVKNQNVKNLLYVIAVILIPGWMAGLMLKIDGGLIHLLLLIAVAPILINIIQGRKTL